MEQVGIADQFGQSGPWQALLTEYGLTEASVIDRGQTGDREEVNASAAS